MIVYIRSSKHLVSFSYIAMNWLKYSFECQGSLWALLQTQSNHVSNLLQRMLESTDVEASEVVDDRSMT